MKTQIDQNMQIQDDSPPIIDGSPVNVFVRIKPQAQGTPSSLRAQGSSSIFLGQEPKPPYTYDWIGDHNASQDDIFYQVGLPLTLQCFAGYNGVLLAYGQTGSGKSFTLHGDKAEEGLIQRIIDFIFDYIGKKKPQDWKVECSYFQLLHGNYFDLLEEGVPNLDEIEQLKRAGAQTAASMRDFFNQGSRGLNPAASHVVFKVSIEHYILDGAQRKIKHSCLQIVDLAGEALPNLERVIQGFVRPTTHHVGIIDSKFTPMLKGFLADNFKTSILATVNPDPKFLKETIRTLNFAKNAKNLKTVPVVNLKEEESEAMKVIRLEKRNQELEAEVKRLRAIVQQYESRDTPKSRTPRTPRTPRAQPPVRDESDDESPYEEVWEAEPLRPKDEKMEEDSEEEPLETPCQHCALSLPKVTDSCPCGGQYSYTKNTRRGDRQYLRCKKLPCKGTAAFFWDTKQFVHNQAHSCDQPGFIGDSPKPKKKNGKSPEGVKTKTKGNPRKRNSEGILVASIAQVDPSNPESAPPSPTPTDNSEGTKIERPPSPQNTPPFPANIIVKAEHPSPLHLESDLKWSHQNDNNELKNLKRRKMKQGDTTN